MHELYELKEKLCDELKEYGRKDMSAGTLEVVDKLTHTIKNLEKIIENYENEEYSGYYGGSMRSNMDGARNYNNRRSYGRGNSYGRYSRDEHMVSELRDLMNEAPDERTRKEFERFISKIESM
ncbi:MAG: hypothetical protein J6D29_01660 [Solobacterium sp.]|nr:hypothetical protein [Solobacterium sp.]